MEQLRAWIPFAFSPRFWAVVITATFQLALTKGWLDEATATWLRNIAAGATAVGISGWLVTKVNVKQ